MGELVGLVLGSFLWVAAFGALARRLFKAELGASLWIGYACSVAFASLSFAWQQADSATTSLLGYLVIGPLMVWANRKRIESKQRSRALAEAKAPQS